MSAGVLLVFLACVAVGALIFVGILRPLLRLGLK